MTISKLALAAKKVIDAAWLHGDAYDLSSQAAFALESAQLLQSPGTAAELKRLQDRVIELEQLLADAPVAVTLTEKAVEPPAEDVRPQVRKLRALLAGQRAAVEDPHDSPLHHTYLVGRDLPLGGA